MEERGIKLRLSLIGVKAVLFLLHVGQLRVAKTEHFTVIKQCVCKALKTREEFLFGLRTGAVAPTALVLTPLNAAVFADERCFALVGLAVRVVVKQCALGHQLVIVLLKDLRVLLVIVHAENISCHMIVAARINARTGRIKRFRCSVNDVECVVKLFPAVSIPCLEMCIRDRNAIVTWYQKFKESVFFRKLFFLAFVTSLILFRTLLNRNLWMNPLSDVMGGWGIWETVNGEQKLSTECIENVIMMVPFTSMVIWTFQEKVGSSWKKILWYSGKIAFIFSISIEVLQLFLRLGTFQLSDLFYNTVGGMIGGLMYYGITKGKKRL